jgi:predicted lipoprotein with Yx(FWY)xxD motif
MKKATLLAVTPIAAAIVIAGCGGGGGSAYGSAPAAPSTPAAPSRATVTLKPSKLGNYLADNSGRTLYLFEADRTSSSTCYSACASLWPPLTSTGALKPGPGVLASDLGTTRRSDGTTEVTYHGHPLYYYAGDSKPGSVAGQGLNQFGAGWYVVSPSGSKIDNGQ